jgi:hypothetical protein
MSVQETKVDEIELFLALGSSTDPDPKKPMGTLLIMETVQTTGNQTKTLSQRWEWDKAPIGEQSGDFVWGRLNGVPFIVCKNEFRTVTIVNLKRWTAGSPRPPFRPWFEVGQKVIGNTIRESDQVEISLVGKVKKAAL